MPRKASALSEFKEVAAIPPKRRTNWANSVLDEFINKDDRKIICAEYEDDKKAITKQAALKREVAAEDSPYAGKVNIERRGSKVYLEKR